MGGIVHTKASRLNGVIGWAVMAEFMAITVPAEEARELSNQALTISAPAVTSQLQHLLERRDFGGREVEITDLQGRTLIRSTQSLELQSREALSILDASRVESQVIVRPAGTVLLRLTPEPMDLPGGVAVTRFDEATAAESEGWFQPTLEATPVLARYSGVLWADFPDGSAETPRVVPPVPASPRGWRSRSSPMWRACWE